jgi:hypothetical protein
MTSSSPVGEAIGEAAHPGLQHGAELAGVALRERPAQLDLEGVDHAGKRRVGRQQRPAEAVAVGAHAEAARLAIVEGEALHGQRVGHLVGEDDAAELARQGVEPADAVAPARPQPGLLALAQLGARLEHVPGQARLSRVSRGEVGLGQRRLGQCARAAAQLQHLAAADRGQHLENLACHAAAEQRGDFRRGDEIAGRAELGRAAAVIAQSRRVQAQLHVTAEADGAAGANHLLAQQRRERLAARQRVRRRRRQGAARGGLRDPGRQRLGGQWRQSSGQWRRANGDGSAENPT